MGHGSPTISDSVVNSAIKSKQNKESIKGDPERAVITVQLMKTLKKGIIKSSMSTDTKRTLWTIFFMKFMGSLRGSELLGLDPLKIYPCKTLCRSDVKIPGWLFSPPVHEIYSQEILEVTGNPCGYTQDFTIKESLGL